jgi:hypothetical protein
MQSLGKKSVLSSYKHLLQVQARLFKEDLKMREKCKAETRNKYRENSHIQDSETIQAVSWFSTEQCTLYPFRHFICLLCLEGEGGL